MIKNERNLDIVAFRGWVSKTQSFKGDATTISHEIDTSTNIPNCKDVKDYVDKNSSIDINQKWEDLTSNRAINVTYTNTTNKPIILSVIFFEKSGGTGNIFVNDYQVASQSLYTTGGGYLTVTALIPVNASYSCKIISNVEIQKWSELR